MAIEFIDHLPGGERGSRRGRVPYASKEIDDFLRGDGRYAEVTIEKREPKNMAQSFRVFLKKNPEIAKKVSVHLIGGKLYLEKTIEE